jgi:hypothetical protein
VDENGQDLVLSIRDGMIAKGQTISIGWQKDGILVIKIEIGIARNFLSQNSLKCS